MPTRAEVSAAARRAQLSLGAEEIGRITNELSAILEHTEALHALRPELSSSHEQAVQPEQSTPRSRVPHPASRPDTTGADHLAVPPSCIAPEWRDGYFTVPRLRTHDAPE